MNVIDWMVKTSEFMAKDRPDLYRTAEDAFADLSEIHGRLAEIEGPSWTAWGGFFLHKWEEDDSVEWLFTKKISEAVIFPSEGDALVTGWTKNSGTLKTGVDLPPVDEIE